MKTVMNLTIWLTTTKKIANVHIYQISNLGLQLCSHLPGSACSIDTCHTQHQGVTPDKRLARRHVEYHHISHRRCRMHLLHILLVTTRKKIILQRHGHNHLLAFCQSGLLRVLFRQCYYIIYGHPHPYMIFAFSYLAWIIVETLIYDSVDDIKEIND